MAEKISAVYKITNTITNDFYIGSSKNIKQRWTAHKSPSRWNECPNNPMYQDMQKYGLDKFVFEILAEVEVEQLRKTEQQFIEKLKPTYNNIRAKGWNIERSKESHREYEKSDKFKKYQKEYRKTDKYKEIHRISNNKYNNQLCCFNGETLTLNALSKRFRKMGIPHPTAEAKKYLFRNLVDKIIDLKK